MNTREQVFLATLGQRPQAITMALDLLQVRYQFTSIGLLHTSAVASAVAAAFDAVCSVFRRDFPRLLLTTHELTYRDGTPLIDIADGRSAEAYYRSTAEVLRQYRARGATVHLLVAGGRKAMSIYACLAASLLFGENDHVWTILAGSDVISGEAYHIPPGKLDAVHIVDLPVLPSRLLPGVLADTDIIEWSANRGRPRERFLKSLSAEENALVDMLHTHTYASNDELSRYLGKSVKTIENQLRSIYKKLSEEFELAISPQRKRQILLDVIEGRV